MGNSHTALHKESKALASRFTPNEMCVLEKTWQDLADRNNGKGIDKETFLQYFPLHGLLGDRLFAEFDTKKYGYIDFEEFISGLCIACRGSFDEKTHFLFNMMDVMHDNKISKQELSTLLNQVPKSVLHAHDNDYPRIMHSPSCGSLALEAIDAENIPVEDADNTEDKEVDGVDNFTNHDVTEKAFNECDIYHEGRLSFEEFKMWLQRNPSLLEYLENILPYGSSKSNNAMLDKIQSLPHSKKKYKRQSIVRQSSHVDLETASNGGGRRFSINTSAPPLVRTNSLASNQGGNNGAQLGLLSPHGTPLNHTLPVGLDLGSTSAAHGEDMSDVGSVVSESRSNSSSNLVSINPQLGGLGGANVSGPWSENDDSAVQLLTQAFQTASNESLKNLIASLLETVDPQLLEEVGDAQESEKLSLDGYLWKKGKSLHMMSKRYYLLSGQCLYYYNHKKDVVPRGVVFLTGSIIEKRKDDNDNRGYYGFELLHQDLCAGEHHRHEQRILYCSTESERDRWVSTLQRAAHVIPIEDDYIIGKEIGRGRFSVVSEGVHKVTGKHCAVKIIDKATIEPDEKALLRTEIVVLKMVNHPNIIKLEGIYESRTHLYIVMEMLQGGELFQRIVGRPRFQEAEAARVIRPLLESVAYLHDLGIVHRDIKPENILCGADLEDLKIADFGLSRMVLPNEKMDAACGTLSYVAPEVLTMQGYNKEADMWSVGVILFLLLCGKLPFDGDDHNEIIRSTIQDDFSVNPAIWNKLSEDARSLIRALLNKSAKNRINARDALKHNFIIKNAGPMNRKKASVSVSSSTSTAAGAAAVAATPAANSANGNGSAAQSLTFTSGSKLEGESVQGSSH